MSSDLECHKAHLCRISLAGCFETFKIFWQPKSQCCVCWHKLCYESHCKAKLAVLYIQKRIGDAWKYQTCCSSHSFIHPLHLLFLLPWSLLYFELMLLSQLALVKLLWNIWFMVLVNMWSCLHLFSWSMICLESLASFILGSRSPEVMLHLAHDNMTPLGVLKKSPMSTLRTQCHPWRPLWKM